MEQINQHSTASVEPDGSIWVELSDGFGQNAHGWIEFDVLERLYLAAKKVREERA